MKRFLMIFLFMSDYSLAKECQIITVADLDQEYHANVSVNTGLHITFYDDIVYSALSHDKLWEAKKSDSTSLLSHLWIYSRNPSEDQNMAGVSIVLANGDYLSLVLHQKQGSSSCLRVKDNSSDAHVIVDRSPSINNQSNLLSQVTEPSLLITSSYDFDKSLVRSVHDDSRFTHVSLVGDGEGEGAYSVVAYFDDMKHIVDKPKYDKRTNTYTIPGIHDVIVFENHKRSFLVERK